MLSETFLTELEEIDDVLQDARTRLDALHGLAIYEEIHPEATRRILSKRNTIDLVRSQVSEVPELAAQQAARR